MDQLFSGTKKRSISLISTLIFVLFFAIFLPMRHQLKKQALENYQLLAESKWQTVMELVGNSLSAAKSLSSRTVIKEYIVQYQDGKMTWEQLQEQTEPKYADGIQVIQNLKLAMRQVSGVPLVALKQEEIDTNHYAGLFSSSSNTQFLFENTEHGTQIVVYSPILHQSKLIGSDLIVVDVSDLLRDLEKNGFHVSILNINDPLLKGIKTDYVYETFYINQLSYTCMAKFLNHDHFIFISKLTAETFESINQVSWFSIVGFILGLTFIFMALYMSLTKQANTMIREIGSSRDVYMKYANYDFLTGAYTRVFFDNWVKNHIAAATERRFVVVMIDVDHFKCINDTYGHETGDEVLKFISSTLIGALHKSDLVIRFGGDEFIVVLESVSPEKVMRIFNRIEQSIQETNQFGFDIYISYGIEEVLSLSTIYQSIKKADEKMYRNKKAHQHTVHEEPRNDE